MNEPKPFPYIYQTSGDPWRAIPVRVLTKLSQAIVNSPFNEVLLGIADDGSIPEGEPYVIEVEILQARVRLRKPTEDELAPQE